MGITIFILARMIMRKQINITRSLWQRVEAKN